MNPYYYTTISELEFRPDLEIGMEVRTHTGKVGKITYLCFQGFRQMALLENIGGQEMGYWYTPKLATKDQRHCAGGCGTVIEAYELCQECAKGKDPFSLDPDNHEYQSRTVL